MDSQKQTPLHLAASMGHLRVVRYLISVGADVNAQAVTGDSALFFASFNEHTDVLLELLKNDADPNLSKEGGLSVLHWVIQKGSEDLFDTLLKFGDKINLNAKCTMDETDSDITPIYLAAELGLQSIVNKLVAAGANMDLPGTHGQTPLIVALSNGYENVAIDLIESGCNIRIRTDNGASALHYAVISECARVVKMLLERGADPNILCSSSDIDNISPLHLACEAGNLQYAKLLIQHGAEINTEQNENSYLPFISAVYGGNVQIIRLLLDHGADATFKLKDGFTAIHVALSLEKNHVETLAEVLSCEQLDVNEKITNEKGEPITAIHMAAERGEPQLIRMLIDRGADINVVTSHMRTPLIIACQHNMQEAAVELIEQGADVTARTEDGTTALHLASANSFEIVQMLIERGADVNAVTVSGDLQGATPLHIACEFGQTEIASLLIEKGANINSRLHNGQPPLINACKSGNAEIVQILLEHGADATLTSSGNTSALHVAVMTGSIDIVRLLIAKSDINFQNQEGNAALHIAYGVENNEIIQELIKNGADKDIVNLKNEKPMEYKM